MKVRRVVVAGHGVAPAMAAIALRRAFARAGIEVTWVETPGDLSVHAAYAALPNLRAFHQLLGLAERDLLRACAGSFALGRQYVGFSGGAGEFLHSYGPVGRPVAGLPFAQFWLKARRAGLPARFEDFAREAVAARNGRLRLADGTGGAATAHGYHLDACGYAALLRAHAVREGIAVLDDPAPMPAIEEESVAALRLSDGRMVAGDLFVDATPDGAIRNILGGEQDDAAVSGCDHMMLASARPLQPLPLYGRVVAHRAGWYALHPLRDRTAIVMAWEGAEMRDEEAMALAPLPLLGTPTFVPLHAQRRRQPWRGNVVAIGDAAARIEPLAATDLHRLQVAITHLVSLFPVRADAMPEAGIYNEELAAWHARLQDFQAAHYALNRRAEPFWRAARARAHSPELDAKIALFAARGMIAQYNQESFAEDEWQAVLLGHGVAPRSWDPQVDRVDEQLVMTDFRDQLAAIRADVTAMDTHDAALARAMAR